MVLFSVVIPTHGRPERLGEAVASVQRQGDRVECIVVDDASPEPAQAPSGVTIVRLDRNQGPSGARMAGVALAKGQYLAFLDDDDALLPGWVDTMGALVGSAVGVVCCGTVVEDVETGRRADRPPKGMGPAYADQVASFLPGSYAVNTEAFREVGGFAGDIPYGEHHELALRLIPHCLSRGLTIESSPRSLVLKRHDRSLAVRRSYHHSRVEAVERQLARHARRLSKDPAHRADLAGVGGYSAAALQEYSRARLLYWAAIRGAPRRLKNYARYGATFAPFIRTRLWK